MRLHFDLTPNLSAVPFDYQHYLVGTFHKWMGINIIHDSISLYSLSWLQGGQVSKTGLEFPNGARWFVSFWDNSIGKQLISAAQKNPEVCCGMSVSEIHIQDNPEFRSKERFIVSSPIFIRKYNEKKQAIHLTYDNTESDKYLTDTMKRKLWTAGLVDDISVRFDRDYQRAKTKLVKINGIENRANLCPVIIEGNPSSVCFAWNVGIGHSTGSGFGALN